MRKFYLCFFELFICLAACNVAIAQKNADTPSTYEKIVPGAEYKASGLKRWLWGDNYREEWTMPATVKVLKLYSNTTGYTILKPGNINQNLNLHVKNAAGKEYLIRSVNKTLGKNLPELFHKTFIEQRLSDGGSASNPYAAAPVPVLAKAAGIYSANTSYRYVPVQPALGNYNNVFGNHFLVFEEIAPGNFKNYITTSTLLDTLNYDPNISIDEKALVKARLFDMFLNDWNRPEQNWLWGKTTNGDKTIYIPLPVNRDQAFSDYDGFLFGASIGAGGLNYFQDFKNDIPNVNFINQKEKDLDRRLLNQVSLEDWQNAARELNTSLTDTIIQEAIKQFPPEIYASIGASMISTLKDRRNHIMEWADKYYRFISKEVHVTGTSGNNNFNIERLNNDEVLVQVFNAGINTPYYSRTFKPSETKAIRLFGLNGDDIYQISGKGSNSISIAISDGITSRHSSTFQFARCRF